MLTNSPRTLGPSPVHFEEIDRLPGRTLRPIRSSSPSSMTHLIKADRTTESPKLGWLAGWLASQCSLLQAPLPVDPSSSHLPATRINLCDPAGLATPAGHVEPRHSGEGTWRNLSSPEFQS